MADYGHDLLFGSFITPTAHRRDDVVALTRLSERVGLDLATFQDHPYQPALLDTWTLLSYLAGLTSRIRLTANVLNLPLRQPVLIARSAAGLDLLTGGRVELGLGAGAFWEAIEASGGRRLTPGQAVDALAEAITIIRQVWDTGRRGGVRVDGDHYRVVGAKRGPAPAHDIGIWVGAYKPRMLRLIGRSADGWLPTLGYLPNGPAELAGLNAHIDDAASTAGRDPRSVRRLLNIAGQFTASGSGLLTGPVGQWVEQLADLALEHGISGFILASDDPAMIERFAAEVAPGVREVVAGHRSPADRPDAEPPAVDRNTADRPDTDRNAAAIRPGVAVGGHRLWDESTRPVAPRPAAEPGPGADRAVGRHLVEVHDHLRAELEQVRDLLAQVRAGSVGAGEARGALHRMTMRQNNWSLGAYCASYCSLVNQHHGLEDGSVFPHLRQADAALAPVLDRLQQEHVVIHDVVEGVDRALVEVIRESGDLNALQEAVDLLAETLLSHLAYEEQQLVEPLSRHGFFGAAPQ